MRLESQEQAVYRKKQTALSGRDIAALLDEIAKYEAEGENDIEYSDEDRAEIERRKLLFDKESPEQKERKIYATILEMVVMEFGNSWITGSFIKASCYDDYLNGTDIIFELEKSDGAIFRLAIDVTSSEQDAVRKTYQVLGDIGRGDFQKIKYLHSDLENFKGQTTMPKVIIGADRSEIVELGALYMRHKNASSPEIRTRILEQIENHHFGSEMLAGILAQIDEYINRMEQSRDSKKIPYLEKIRESVELEKENAPGNTRSVNKVQAAIISTLRPATAGNI